MAVNYQMVSYIEVDNTERDKKRDKELSECASNSEKIALKQLWAIEDISSAIRSHPTTTCRRSSDGIGGGLFGLGMLGLLLD